MTTVLCGVATTTTGAMMTLDNTGLHCGGPFFTPLQLAPALLRSIFESGYVLPDQAQRSSFERKSDPLSGKATTETCSFNPSCPRQATRPQLIINLRTSYPRTPNITGSSRGV